MNILFFIPIIIIYAYTGTISSSMLKERYKKRIILSVISLVYGISLEILLKDERKFSYVVLGFLPLLNLFCYEMLRVIFKPIIGKYPYSPYREKIGSKVIGKGYPQNRKVRVVDYFFGLTYLLLPIILLVLFLSITKNPN